MDVLLETERLALRQITAEDVDALFELDSDPDVMMYINGGTSTSRQEIEEDYIPYYLEFYEKYTGLGFWAAIEKATGAFLEWFHFRPNEGGSTGEIEIGYRLNMHSWGKGYATEGSRALIHKGFTELGVERVVASAFAVNTSSRRVMEKCGMILERIYQVDWPFEIEGIEQGVVDYALTKEQWQKRQHS